MNNTSILYLNLYPCLGVFKSTIIQTSALQICVYKQTNYTSMSLWQQRIVYLSLLLVYLLYQYTDHVNILIDTKY
jgi:hypothetical protein